MEIEFFFVGKGKQPGKRKTTRKREKKIPFPGFSIRHKRFLQRGRKENRISGRSSMLSIPAARSRPNERKKRATKMSAWGHIRSFGGKRFQDGGEAEAALIDRSASDRAGFMDSWGRAAAKLSCLSAPYSTENRLEGWCKLLFLERDLKSREKNIYLLKSGRRSSVSLDRKIVVWRYISHLILI